MEIIVKGFAFISILLIGLVLFPELSSVFSGYSSNIFPGFFYIAFILMLIGAAYTIKNSDI